MIANKYIKILIFDILFCTTCSVVVGKYEKCDSYQKLKPLEQFVISSTVPGYLNGVECRWTVEAFPGYTLSLNCYDVRIPFSIACFNSQMLVSTTGRADLYDANRYCGNTPFQVESLSTRMTISLKRTPTSRDVNVRCIVRSIKTFCTCGSKNRGKIGKLKLFIFYTRIKQLINFAIKNSYAIKWVGAILSQMNIQAWLVLWISRNVEYFVVQLSVSLMMCLT